MSLLRRTRTEMAGAWRSLRYDMGRTPVEPPADGPDMTSTGMNTFGLGSLLEGADPVPAARPQRKPRRAVAVTAFGTLTVLGAAGAYLVVVNGLGSLLSETTAAAGTVPSRPAVTTAVGLGPGSPAGRAPATTAAGRPVTPVADAAVGTGPAAPAHLVPTAVATPPPPEANAPIRTTKPANPECHCNPPVPTPTAPTSSPSAAPSPTPSESGSAGPGPSPSDSADPSGEPDHSASPSRSWDGHGHRRRH